MDRFNINQQYRATLWKYRKFKHRLDKRLRNNTLSELSARHRNRLLKTIERLRRRLAAMEARLKYASMGAMMSGALLLSDPVQAQAPTPVGSEFLVNTYTTSGQRDSSIAMDADGDFVVTWSSDKDGGSFNYGIYAQRYNAMGVAQGAEFQVSTYTTNNQRLPSIAMDANGDFVIAWTSEGQDGDQSGIYAQRFNATGVAQGGEFMVNTFTTDHQRNSSIAMDDDGNFVIAWQSRTQDGSNEGVYARSYNASGVAQGAEFQVNTYTASGQENPVVAMDSDGDFVITWSSFFQDGSIRSIYAQRYDATGAAQGMEFRVNTYTTGNQNSPTMAMDADGDFIIAWSSDAQDGDSYGIFAQRYDATGVAQGTEFQVHTYTTGIQFDPAVAMDSYGGFAVAWSSANQDGSSFGKFAQYFNAVGEPVGDEFQVNTYTTSQQRFPSVAMDADGNFAVSWSSTGQDGEFYGIYAQRYSKPVLPPPTPLGSEFQVNTYTSGDQHELATAMDANGDFVIAWESYGQDGSGGGIYAQLYDASGAAQGPEFLVNTYTTGNQRNPSVAMDYQGNFVVAWDSYGQDGSNAGVYAQRYNAAGVAQGGEFLVNTFTTALQSRAAVAMDADGDFVIAWQSEQDGSLFGVYAQRFNALGVAQGGEFQVNTFTTSFQSGAAIAMDSDGDFVIAWQSVQDGNSFGIYAQRYNAAGVAQGGEFPVNQFTTSFQGEVSVGMDAEGDFVISWGSYTQDGDGDGIYARRYNASGVALGSEFLVNTHTTSGQRFSSVAVDVDGDFVITWSSLYQDGDDMGIYAQRYNAAGAPKGDEFQVSTYTTAHQIRPFVAIDADGDFVIAWESIEQDGSAEGIFAQRFQTDNPDDCDVPTGLQASGITNTDATLSWDDVNPGELYDLEYQPVIGGSWTLVSGINSSQYLLDNVLDPGTRYKYRVRGVCMINEEMVTTDFSPVAQFETTIDGCDIPTGLSATPIGNTSANITWTGSTSDNYILEYRNQDLAAQPWVSVDVNMATSHLLDNVLLAGTQYKYRVTRECVLENNVTVLTDTSAPMFFTTGAAGCDVPTGLMAVIVNNTSATISWSGSTADNYLLEYRNQDLPGQPWVGVNVNMATSTLLNNVLNPGTRYKYRVSRECDLSGTIVNTPPSAASFFTTSTSGCDIPTNPATPVIGDTDVTITWDEVNTGVPGEAYLLEYRIASGGSWQQMAISGGTENLMGLMEGTRYKYRIFGQCELEMGVTVTTDPSAIGVFETTVSKELSDAPSLVEALTQGEEGTALKLLTYPNPSAGMVTLSFVPNETGTGRVSIYSLNGSKVYDREFEDRLEELIDLSTNGKGMYLVRLAFNGQTFENRIIVR